MSQCVSLRMALSELIRLRVVVGASNDVDDGEIGSGCLGATQGGDVQHPRVAPGVGGEHDASHQSPSSGSGWMSRSRMNESAAIR